MRCDIFQTAKVNGEVEKQTKEFHGQRKFYSLTMVIFTIMFPSVLPDFLEVQQMVCLR